MDHTLPSRRHTRAALPCDISQMGAVEELDWGAGLDALIFREVLAC